MRVAQLLLLMAVACGRSRDAADTSSAPDTIGPVDTTASASAGATAAGATGQTAADLPMRDSVIRPDFKDPRRTIGASDSLKRARAIDSARYRDSVIKPDFRDPRRTFDTGTKRP